MVKEVKLHIYFQLLRLQNFFAQQLKLITKSRIKMKTQSYILQIEDLMNLNLDRFLVQKNNHKNISEYEYIAKNISSISQKAQNI